MLPEKLPKGKSLKKADRRMTYMERYRRGHNGADSKSAMYSDEVSVENPVVMRVFSF